MNLNVKILENEIWYGGSVADAMNGPFDCRSIFSQQHWHIKIPSCIMCDVLVGEFTIGVWA